ncbi:C45 family peptidase [Alcaligenaceae bacterium LF4-65]|uniref:C45 family peptidase n=1 Tax=Zwartia hollandica TaxID=324606 RepID=A0A953NCX3_9BURK|nr:C45 family peptidase [Zwartia hollandica]MBZ1351344.1 C45 family peptidase [Zwartia hollandica]
MTSRKHMPALTVGDNAYERGLKHGQQFASDVAANVETYLLRFEASGLPRAEALEEAMRWQHAMESQNAEYAEEMLGLAKGSGQSAAAIALLNARYEIAFMIFGKDARKQEQATNETDGCTTFGLLSDVTADGHTWLGQNWDWIAGVHQRTLVLRIQRKNKPSLVCMTEAGIVGGKMGVNELGIGLVENGLASHLDGCNPYQKPFHMRCREVLDADCYANALSPIVATKRTCSANFVIGGAQGEIIDLETSPNHVSYLLPQQGIVTHSNHFLGAGHGDSQMEKVSPGTLFRAARMRRLLEKGERSIDVATMIAAMSDHFSFPHALCRHPDPKQAPAKQTMTTGAVLIDLEQRTMHVADGPPCEFSFVAHTVSQ